MSAFTFGTFKQINKTPVVETKANSVAEKILREDIDPFDNGHVYESKNRDYRTKEDKVNEAEHLVALAQSVGQQASSALNGVKALAALQEPKIVKNPLKTMEQLELELSTYQIENEKLKMELKLIKAEVDLIRDLTNQILKT